MKSEQSPRGDNLSRPIASLCLYGDNLDPVIVTRRMGMAPSDSSKRGGTHKAKSGKMRTARTGMWILHSGEEVKSDDISDHIGWLLSRIPNSVADLREIDGVERATISCCILIDEEVTGLTIPTDTMKRCIQHGTPVEFEMFDVR